jgi:hypothetical protein
MVMVARDGIEPLLSLYLQIVFLPGRNWDYFPQAGF